MDKRQLFLAGIIFTVVAGLVAGLLYYTQNRNGSEVEQEYDLDSLDFEPRNDPVLMIPGPDATEEEREEYEELVQNRLQQTGTLYVEDCQTRPIVAKMVSEAGLRIVNNGDRGRTLIFEFGEYEIPANGEEYINIVKDGGKGMHFYGCDVPLTAGVIIAEDFEFEI